MRDRSQTLQHNQVLRPVSLSAAVSLLSLKSFKVTLPEEGGRWTGWGGEEGGGGGGCRLIQVSDCWRKCGSDQGLSFMI